MDFLSNLKIGDRVILAGSQRGSRVAEVTGVTETQIRIGDLKFRKKSGSQVNGDTYWSLRLEEATDDAVLLIQRRNAKARLLHEIRTVVASPVLQELDHTALAAIMQSIQDAINKK